MGRNFSLINKNNTINEKYKIFVLPHWVVKALESKGYKLEDLTKPNNSERMYSYKRKCSNKVSIGDEPLDTTNIKHNGVGLLCFNDILDEVVTGDDKCYIQNFIIFQNKFLGLTNRNLSSKWLSKNSENFKPDGYENNLDMVNYFNPIIEIEDREYVNNDEETFRVMLKEFSTVDALNDKYYTIRVLSNDRILIILNPGFKKVLEDKNLLKQFHSDIANDLVKNFPCHIFTRSELYEKYMTYL